MERITIQNFGGISNFTFELNKINLLIGPQASGKSICAKLLYYFKRFENEFINSIEIGNNIKEFEKLLLKKFEEYFPSHTYSKTPFLIRYELNHLFIEVKGSINSKVELEYSDFFKKEFAYYKSLVKRLNKTEPKDSFELNLPIEIRGNFYEKLKNEIGLFSGFTQLFIPAGRSFFANLQSSVFSFLSLNQSFDPFLVEFGSFYERTKGFSNGSFKSEKENISELFAESLIERILSGKYVREKNTDYLVHDDGRKIDVAYSSSGQQETLPLTIILKYLLNYTFITNGATVYIEEPEAHLFPSAQRLIVEFISHVFNNSKSNYQFIITTHSPYILTSFNNLIQAGILKKQLREKDLNTLYEIVKKEVVLAPENLYAYSLSNGNYETLLNEDTNLISSNVLDAISEDLAIQFDSILNLL